MGPLLMKSEPESEVGGGFLWIGYRGPRHAETKLFCEKILKNPTTNLVVTGR